MFDKSTLPSPRTIATSSSEGPQQENTEENHQEEQQEEQWRQQRPRHTSSTIIRNEWSWDEATSTARARQDFVLAVIDSALETLGTYEDEEDEEEDDKTTHQESNILLPQ